MVKALKSITRKKQEPRNLSPFILRDLRFSFNDHVASEPFIKWMCEELTKWVDEKPENLCLNTFLRKHKINPELWSQWKKRWPQLRDAHEYAFGAFTEYREVGALTRKLDSAMAQKSIMLYSKDWRDLQKWIASLKESGIEPTVINALLADYFKRDKVSQVVDKISVSDTKDDTPEGAKDV